MYESQAYKKFASSDGPVVVIINDNELMMKLACDLAEAQGCNVAAFREEDEAFEFLVRHGDRVCSVWTDTHHPQGDTVKALLKLNRIGLPGNADSHLDFLYGAVDAYAPEARVAFYGGFAGAQAIDHEIAAVDERVEIMTGGQMIAHFGRSVLLWHTRRQSGPISKDVATVKATGDELAIVCGRVPDLLDRVSPRQFEEMVGAIFRNHGFSVELTSQTRDGGYDLLVVSNSRLEREVAVVEVKHYRRDRPVGVEVVRQLYGVRSLKSVPRCYLVTSSTVSAYAKREFAHVVPRKLEFIERHDILGWCRDHHAGIIKGDSSEDHP